MHSLVLVFTHQVNFQKDHISWLLGQLRLKHILWSQFLPHRIPPSWIVSKVELNFQQSHTFSNQTEIYSGSTQIYQSSQKFSKIIGSKSFSHHSQWNLKWTCIMESQWLIVIKRGTLHYTLELFVWISIGCYFMPHWILHLFFFLIKCVIRRQVTLFNAGDGGAPDTCTSAIYCTQCTDRWNSDSPWIPVVQYCIKRQAT